MSVPSVPSNQLYQVLQNTGLQNDNMRLYQLLRYMIGILINTNPSGTSGGSGSTVINNNTYINQILGMIGQDGQDGDIGPPGAAGINGANGMVPYYIASTETFTVPIYKQALFSMNIDNEGILVLDGFLIEVD
jgi:hypothetical protein